MSITKLSFVGAYAFEDTQNQLLLNHPYQKDLCHILDSTNRRALPTISRALSDDGAVMAAALALPLLRLLARSTACTDGRRHSAGRAAADLGRQTNAAESM
jgi:hypothetical protein